MTNSKRRGKYRNIRYEYYHCGRSLMFEGNFFAGGIMLGYAVETTLKTGLLEVLNNEERARAVQLEGFVGVVLPDDARWVVLQEPGLPDVSELDLHQAVEFSNTCTK